MPANLLDALVQLAMAAAIAFVIGYGMFSAMPL